jgi:hypothetical protein
MGIGVGSSFTLCENVCGKGLEVEVNWLINIEVIKIDFQYRCRSVVSRCHPGVR